jgi:hypothetical protein
MVRKSVETRLSVEEVEQRLLLAATVEVQNGQLGILGTTGNDVVVVAELANATPGAGNYVVITKGAFNPPIAKGGAFVTAGTPLGNGFSAVIIDAKAVNNDIQIKLGDGDDTLIMGNSQTLVTSKVLTAAQFKALGTLTVPDDVRIDAGSGSDNITITNSLILNNSSGDNSDKNAANLDVKLGSGVNKLTLDKVQVNGNVNVAGSENSVDTVVIQNSKIGGKVNLDLGAGNDNVVIVNSNFADRVQFNLGDGNDNVVFAGKAASNFQKAFTINGGAGNDSVTTAAGGNFNTFASFTQPGVETKIA